MLYNHYRVEASYDYRLFEFISTGPKGNITKVVFYEPVNNNNYFNLGFGDKDPGTGIVNDRKVTNNGDSKKVLESVAATLVTFTRHYPKATVLISGNSEPRNRLYRIGISNNIQLIEQEFVVMGLTEDGWEIFMKNRVYEAFLVKRKL